MLNIKLRLEKTIIMCNMGALNSRNTNFYFIAEIGVNHEGSLERAKEMITNASLAGANAAKFQVYKAEKLVTKEAKSYWDTREETETSQQSLFKKYDTFGETEYRELARYCEEVGIDFLATPFDVDCLEWLDEISTFYKVASADLTNYQLLNALAKTNKHIVLSVGASSNNEISKAIDYLFESGCPSITLLHCVLNYPCSINNSFLSNILQLKNHFENGKVKIGYSDHVPSKEANDDQLIAALAMGCRVFERHFTYDISLPGNDHYHALDNDQLESVIRRLKILLPGLKDFTPEELLVSQQSAIKNARRSIVLKRDLKIDDVITEQDIMCKRPAVGIPASEFFNVLGKKVKKNLTCDTHLQYVDLEDDQSVR
jgi:sialic acid synthase SpsE